MPSPDYEHPLIRVLLVDDDVVVRARLIAGLDALSGFRLEHLEAENGEEALARLADGKKIDLVITDLIMPGMDGFELLQRIKSDSELGGIPVVVLSGKDSARDITTALRHGALDYLVKPPEPDELAERLERAVSLALRLRRADRAVHLEEETERCTAAWMTTRRLERSRSFELRRIEEVELLCDLLIPYFPEASRDLSYLGLREILTNAIVHGNLEIESSLREGSDGLRLYLNQIETRVACSPFRERRAYLYIERDDRKIQVTVTDQGSGFDLAEVEAAQQAAGALRQHGRGLQLTRYAFDEFDVSFPPEGGTRVVLVRELRASKES